MTYFIEIDIPNSCSTQKEVQEFILKVYNWGLRNINDQESWENVLGLLSFAQPHTKKLEFCINNEQDALAIKLTWS